MNLDNLNKREVELLLNAVDMYHAYIDDVYHCGSDEDTDGFPDPKETKALLVKLQQFDDAMHSCEEKK